jgi:hypothetical protein
MDEEIKPGYTRITEILSPWNNFEGIPKDVLENKRCIGVRVHEYINLYLECIPVTVDEEAEGYFESFRTFMVESEASVRKTEERYYDDVLKITGQVDALVKFKAEDELIVVDWKTSASYNRKTGRSWAIQGVLYHYLLEQNGVDNLSDKIIFLQLDKGGGLPHARRFQYSSKMMARAMAVLEAYRHFNPVNQEEEDALWRLD